MSKTEETPNSFGLSEPLKQTHAPINEIEIGPQRRKRMPAGRHLDAVKTVLEPPKTPLKFSEQLQTQVKAPEVPNTQSKGSEQSARELQELAFIRDAQIHADSFASKKKLTKKSVKARRIRI
ncbi:hypothetical protein ACLMJK_005131 [Lecanora helva]